MKVKNLVLFGFVLSALSYLNDQAKDEDNNDFDFLNNLEDVDLDKIRREFGDGLENVVGEFGDVVSSIVKIGSEAFDRYLQNYDSDGEETLKKIKEVIDDKEEEKDEEVPVRSFFEEKETEPDNWAVDLDAFLRGSEETENNVLTDLNALLSELGEVQEEMDKTEEDYLREIEKAVGAQQTEEGTVPEADDEPLMPEMSEAESDEIDALFSEIIAGEKEAEKADESIEIMDGFDGLEEVTDAPEDAVEDLVFEEPAEETPAEPVEVEEPVQEEPEIVEEPIQEEPEIIEEPVAEEPEVAEEPVEEVPQETVEVTEEIPAEETPEEPAETLEPVQEETKELTRSEAIIEEANRYVHDLVADLEEELSLLEEEYRRETAEPEEPAVEEPVTEEPERTMPEEIVTEEPAEEEPAKETIEIMDGFDGLEEVTDAPEDAVEDLVFEEPAEETPAEPVEVEEPVQEEPEIVEEPIQEEPEIIEEPVAEEPEVAEEPVEEVPQETVEVTEEIPAEETPEEPAETLEPVQEEPEIVEEPVQEEIIEETPAEEIKEEDPEAEDRIEIKIEEVPKYSEEDIYAKINDLYPYLSLGFIRSVYELKEVIAEEYPLDKEVIVLHRILFTSVDDLRQFVEIVSNHGYNVNVDENQCIVDIFKQYRNTDGRILTNIFEIANQARLLRGQYDGYRIDVVTEED